MTPSKRLTLIACILGSAIVFVDGSVVNVALPALRADLGASFDGQQWVVEAYLLLLGSLTLVGGSLGDLLGRRRVFVAGVAGFGIASLLCAIAPSIGLLIAARALQGVAGALLVPSSLAIITACFDENERGAAIGSWTAWTSASIAVGPPLGGLLVDAVSWRLVFAINVPLVLTTLWLARRAMPDMPGRSSERIDFVGAVLCSLGLGFSVFALIEQPRRGWGDALILGLLFGGLALLAAFLEYERRASHPMLPSHFFRSRNFAVANLATLTIYAGLGAGSFFVAIFLQQIAGYSALEAGFVLLPITIVILLFSRRFGALADRIGPRALMGGGPFVAAAGLALFLRLDEHAGFLTGVLPAALVFGLGLAMTVAPLTATVLAAVEQEHAGVASGVNNAVARVAGLLAIAIVGLVVSAAYGSALDSDLPPSARDDPAVVHAKERPLVAIDAPRDARLRRAGTDAAVHAFQAGMAFSALLVLLGGGIALIGIENPKRRREPATAEAGDPAFFPGACLAFLPSHPRSTSASPRSRS